MPKAHKDSCTIPSLFIEYLMTTEDKHKEEFPEKSSLSLELTQKNPIQTVRMAARFVKNSIQISVNSQRRLNIVGLVPSLPLLNLDPRNEVAEESAEQRKRPF